MLCVEGEYYPAGLPPPGAPETVPGGEGWTVRRRALTPAAMAALAEGLAHRRETARRVRIQDLLAGLDRAHAAWAADGSEWRAEAVRLLATVTGYPVGLLDGSLRHLFGGLSGVVLERWLGTAGIRPPWLDGDLAEGAPTLVYGPGLTAVFASGNIPGAALPSVVQALLLKSPVLVKTASAEPVLLPLYARSLSLLAPALADWIVVAGWEGGRRDLEEVLLARADAVVAYGEDGTLRDLRARLPAGARFLGYGHRISMAAVSREWLTRERAPAAAARAGRDISLFDQQGCLSPQAVYVERGGDVGPDEFCELLAAALRELSVALPRRRVSAAESAAIHQYRAAVEMRALADSGVRLHASAGGTAWTVALESSASLEPCCLNRTAIVRPVEDLGHLPGWIAGWRSALASVTLGVPAGRWPALAAGLGAAGVTRLAPLGAAQEPRDAGLHDGVHALAVLARFVSVELPEAAGAPGEL